MILTYNHAAGRQTVKGWRCGDASFEIHRGQPHVIPKHIHDAYQIGVITRDPGDYLCDGTLWRAAPGDLLLVHPGQVHSAPRASIRSRTSTSRILFVAPEKMRQVAAAIAGKPAGLPWFGRQVIRDRSFVHAFLSFHEQSESMASRLETESRLTELLARMIRSFGTIRPMAQAISPAKSRLRAVIEYVTHHYAENISLAELAGIARVSPCHLNRTFAQEFGLPPHAFLTQFRVEHAKQLLLEGGSATTIAQATGFFDQSHFTRHFRRIVGAPPGSYASLVNA